MTRLLNLPDELLVHLLNFVDVGTALALRWSTAGFLRVSESDGYLSCQNDSSTTTLTVRLRMMELLLRVSNSWQKRIEHGGTVEFCIADAQRLFSGTFSTPCATPHLVRLLLAQPGIDPNADNGQALLYASQHAFCDVVDVLLTHSQTRLTVLPALQSAFDHFNLPIAKAIINYMDVPLDSHACLNAIFKACDARQPAFLKWLLTIETVEPLPWQECIALQHAVNSNDPNTLEVLLADKRVKLLTSTYNPLFDAARLNLTKSLRFLLAHIPPHTQNDSAFRVACRLGHADAARVLLSDPRVYPGAFGNEPIREAASCGYLTVVQMLLAHPHVNPSAIENRAIRHASENGHADVVRALLAHPRVNPTARHNEALTSARKKGHTKVIEALLSDARVAEHDRTHQPPPTETKV